MKILITVATLSMLSLSYPLLALEYDFENHPSGVSGHASVVETDGELTLVFLNGAQARQAAKLHSILNAYGQNYDFENAPNGVRGYASVATTDKGPTLVFASGHKVWPAARLHEIFSAYGLALLDDKGEPIPDKDLSFSSAHVLLSALELHNILTPYQQP